MNNAGNFRLLVPMTSANRIHLKATRHGFYWSFVNTPLKLTLLPPPRGTNAFYLLCDYDRCANGRVWLAASVASGNLAVINFICGSEASKDAACEADAWKKFGIEAYYTKLIGRHCVVMPYTAHVKETPGMLSLGSDLKLECGGSEALLGIDYYTELQDELLKNTSRDDRMDNAVSYFAKNLVVHDDIEWRNLVVLPIFGKDGKLLRFQDFLIDLNWLESAPTEEVAKVPMLARLNSLEGYRGNE